MTAGVIALVLCAALLHASWNAMLKSSGDRLWAITLMTIGSAVAALPIVLWAPLPAAASWPYILMSVALHAGYNLFLVRAYRAGDFGQSYPIARGSSPLLVSLGAAFFAGEQLGTLTLIGVALISAGIVSLAQIKFKRNGNTAGGYRQWDAPLSAFTTGVFIAGYTIVDGLGSRLAGSAASYAGWMFLLDGLPLLVIYLSLHGRLPLALNTRASWNALGGGVMSLLAYGIVIWAITLAPMGPVSALRETSVLFAALIARIFLGEALTARRLLSCAVIAAGAVVLGWTT
ncbi:DMT family transporter [Collimonas sp.]|jgi:drug/metabolite transporter (DMT)-like permease|uniref:DMT family transporter n=1 Tax=Collimonas sp. TaxID=1963772 RepID=UPI002BFF6064|nr:DMT family transporter [Collimonas sp.]HWX01400.1 DMT family transporter [Collimonas sp.]